MSLVSTSTSSYSLSYINKQDGQGNTMLMNACLAKKLRFVQELLLDPNLNINAQDDNGEMALMAACRVGDPKIFQALLQHPKIDVNLKNNRGRTVLMMAIIWDTRLEMIPVLLQHPKVDVNLVDKDGNTALMIACKIKNVITAQALLKALPAVEGILLKNKEGETAMDIAHSEKSVKIVSALGTALQNRSQEVTTGVLNTAPLPIPLSEIIIGYVIGIALNSGR